MKKEHIQGAIISVGIAWLTGLLSSLIAGNQGTIYQSLITPPFAPPGWLFGVIWPILYTLMGISAYLIYIADATKKDKVISLLMYAIQLIINFSWSIVFFRFKEYGWAVIVLALLLFFVMLTIMTFYKVNKIAALLLIPYYIWLLIAYYLTIGVFLLN